MAEIRAQGFDPVPIGEVVKPPFAQLPDPLAMFARRSRRLKALADGHALRSYLLLLAELSDMQHRVREGLPDVVLPSADALARSRQHRMPRISMGTRPAVSLPVQPHDPAPVPSFQAALYHGPARPGAPRSSSLWRRQRSSQRSLSATAALLL